MLQSGLREAEMCFEDSCSALLSSHRWTHMDASHAVHLHWDTTRLHFAFVKPLFVFRYFIQRHNDDG